MEDPEFSMVHRCTDATEKNWRISLSHPGAGALPQLVKCFSCKTGFDPLHCINLVCLCMPVVLAFGRQGQEEQKFKVIPSYTA